MQKWFNRWHGKQQDIKRTLRDSYIHRILGEHIFHHHIWALDRNSVAGGLSLGLFVAFTPTIPFQMLFCAVLAIFLRINLPVSLAACWITNPITALPIYLAARNLGRYFLLNSSLGEFALSLFNLESKSGKFVEQSLYLWTGSLVFSVLSALVGNAVVRLAWYLYHRLKGKQ